MNINQTSPMEFLELGLRIHPANHLNGNQFQIFGAIGTGNLVKIANKVGILTNINVFSRIPSNYFLMRQNRVFATFSHVRQDQILITNGIVIFKLGTINPETGEVEIDSPMITQNTAQNNQTSSRHP